MKNLITARIAKLAANYRIIYAILFIASSVVCAENNLIKSVSIVKNKLNVVVNDSFREKYLKSDFSAEYDADINLEELDYSIVILPFIMNVISIVWISGETYYVDSMDEDLLESLKRVKAVFKILYPHTNWDGELVPKETIKNVMSKKLDPNKQIALPFSGGLDSVCSSLHHLDKHQLLISVWGHADMPLTYGTLWDKRKHQFIEFAKRFGHTNSFIKSNYYSFLNVSVLNNLSSEISNWRLEAIEGLRWAGLAAPILFSKGYQILYLASSSAWTWPYPEACTPFVDNNIKFAGTRLKHDLFDMNRLEKCEFLVQLIKKKNLEEISLKACYAKTENNCCSCWKCIKTMNALLLAGADISKFGYYIKGADIVKKTRKLLATKVGFAIFYHFRCIQNRINEKIQNSENVAKELMWLSTAKLGREVMFPKHQEKIDWQALHERFPDIEADHFRVN